MSRHRDVVRVHEKRQQERSEHRNKKSEYDDRIDKDVHSTHSVVGSHKRSEKAQLVMKDKIQKMTIQIASYERNLQSIRDILDTSETNPDLITANLESLQKRSLE